MPELAQYALSAIPSSDNDYLSPVEAFNTGFAVAIEWGRVFLHVCWRQHTYNYDRQGGRERLRLLSEHGLQDERARPEG